MGILKDFAALLRPGRTYAVASWMNVAILP